MRNSTLLILFLAIAKMGSLKAQQDTRLDLQEAVDMALTNSNASKIAESKVKIAEGELKTTQNMQYPDFNLSGQYLYLSNADVTLASSGNSGSEGDGEEGDGSGSSTTPDVNSLAFGQASVSMPIFSGFKLKNLVSASKNGYQAATLNAENDQEQIALQTIQLYLSLYKAEQTIELVQENLKSAQQRVKDFTNMLNNGLLAKNDLLKSQLQESNISVSLEEAKKNRRILNSRLATLLKLDKNVTIQPAVDKNIAMPLIEEQSIERKDLEALHYQQEAANDQIKVEKADYYPSLSLSGGYVALDLKNAVTVKNAMNVGVGISYNVANLFKNKAKVKLAESKAQELNYQIQQARDNIALQVENAQDELDVTLNKFTTYTQSEEQAIENYRIVKDKYDNGLVDTNDLLEADVQQLQARINLAYATADITQKYYELLAARGVLKQQFTK